MVDTQRPDELAAADGSRIPDWPRPDRMGSWSESALRVLKERYLLRVGGEVVETPEGMAWRVARAIALAEAQYADGGDEAATERLVRSTAETFYDLIVSRAFLPNSPTLMNAGKGNNMQYSACFVLPVPDDLKAIFRTMEHAAIIHQSGGGTGFAFSRLRPKGDIVSRSGGTASGPVSFLRVYNAATEAVKQGGTRRGANMGILKVDHPDILEFIDCKNDGGITNFNISVSITDAFMRALEEDGEYDLINPATGEVTSRLRARAVWDRIIDSAWRTGDPGLVFIDRINRSPANPVPELETIEATNPCGEQPLAPNDACNLGSINLALMVKDGAVDWDELERVTRAAARFLDDVITVNPYPLPEITTEVGRNRRIGLGVMGWADLLFLLGIPYDSEEALDLGRSIMHFITRVGHEASVELARERGPFPNWEHSIYRDGPPLRNATVTTIAPTGTISIIADASSGIEPVFALAFQHKVQDRVLTFVNPIFTEAARARGIDSADLLDRVAAQGSVHGVPGVPDDMQRVYVTAHEVAPLWHVRMQAAFQQHTDNGVSKTINLPNSATRGEVEEAYNLAWRQGCLGITVFRDGCKGEQVLNVGVGQKSAEADAGGGERVAQAALPGFSAKKPRPARVSGETHRITTPVGTAYVTVNMDESGDPFEVFVNIGSSGSDIMAFAEALGRLISLMLRTPSLLTPREKIHQICDQLQGIGGSRSVGFGPQRVLSLPDALARVLCQYNGLEAEEGGQVTVAVPTPLPSAEVKGDLCPSCGWATYVHEEGCKKCHFCGHSEC